jgi:hypothetical protein
METHPLGPALESRDALIQWVIDMHNEVNKASGKPIWTRERVIEHYTKMAQGKEETDLMKLLVVGGVLGAGVWYAVNQAKKE